MPTPIYHITNINNLSGIVQARRLWCDAERVRQGFVCVSIGYDHLKQRRMTTPVRNRAGQPVAAGGFLGDYTPFYFANRSPMLYSISRGNIVGYAGGQADVIYLVSGVERAVAGNRPWCFTDGHAVESMTEFLTSTERLNTIDWGVVGAPIWYNTPDDPDRKRRKQAEFLIHGSVPWCWFDRIGVIDDQRARRVEEIIAEAEHQPEVVVEPGWYY